MVMAAPSAIVGQSAVQTEPSRDVAHFVVAVLVLQIQPPGRPAVCDRCQFPCFKSLLELLVSVLTSMTCVPTANGMPSRMHSNRAAVIRTSRQTA